MNPEETSPPTEGSPVESSPSLETVELQKVNEKLDTIITEITVEIPEPTPEEIQAQEEQTIESETYQQTTLENAQTEIDLLTEISSKFSTLQTTIETQNENTMLHYEDVKTLNYEQTWTIVIALVIAIGVKQFTDQITKW